MDMLSLLGFFLAFGGILVGRVIEGGELSILAQEAAFLIVFGGTLGAVLIQSPLRVFVTAVKMSLWVIFPPRLAGSEMVTQITEWSLLARKEGLLALDAQLENIADPFLNKGVQLLVDGNSAEKIREVLDVDIHAWEQLRWQAARVWESAGGYSPTIGIIGAVMGLMQVMQNLSDPSKLGAGIAVAFVATIYGVGLANLVFLPVANKLKAIIMAQTEEREMVVEGLVAIANGDNPRLIEIRLQSYLG